MIINGSGFGEGQGSVTFNGLPGAITSWSNVQVIVTVPQDASSGPVALMNDEGVRSNELNFTVTLPPLPDLVVESLTVNPQNPTTADDILITAIVRNQGTSAAALSELQIWVGSEAQGTSHPVPALEAGATFEVTRTVSLSADSYRTIARADHTGVVVEVDETNNESFLDFNVIPSELVAHRVVYSSDETGDYEIFALALDSNLDVLFKYNMTNRTSREAYPRWSPAGDRIAYQSDYDGTSQLWIMDATGSNKRKITNESLAVAPISWSPDGLNIQALMAYPGDGEVVQVNVETGAVTVLTNVPGYNTQHWDLNSAGTKIAYTRGDEGNGFSNLLYMADYPPSIGDFLNIELLSDAVPAPHVPRFSPSGARIAVQLDRLSPWGTGIGIIDTDGSGFWTPIPVDGYVNQTPEWLDENRIIYGHGDNSSNLYVLNLTEMTQKQITSDSGYQGFPDVFSYAPTPPAYSRKVDFNSDGQEDILWRYYGTGAYQGLNLVWLMGQTGSLLPMASAEPQEATRIASVLTGMSDAKPAGLLNKSIESLLTSGKSREPHLRLRMKDPHNAGRMVPSSERQDVRGVSPNDINPRKDALHNLELASGQAGIAAVSVAQEVVFSQIADTAWEIVGTGDFNGDAKTDILWRYYGTGGYQGLNDIWFMDGTTFIGENVFSQIVDTNWRVGGTGDFNGDGETDILWRYYGTGAYQGLNVIWYMNDSTFIGENVFSQVLDTNWRIEGTGDFNGDGEIDILWRYYGTESYQGLNDIWFMNDSAFIGEAVFSQILDTDWKIAGTGDFNNDGQMDILWRYYGTSGYQGLNVIWYMNGTAFVSEEVFSVIPDTNWRIVNR